VLSGRVIVFDVGKTLAKLSLWDADGRLLDQQLRPNRQVVIDGRHCLDTEGVEAWAMEATAAFARQGPVAAIMPVGHGAAAAVVHHGRLACAVPDYEEPVPGNLRRSYDALRDRFALSGSPALPDGLNLGVQLYRLQGERPDLLAGDARILPWPQYWAWRLSGVAASEVSSLGCHTDLWRPMEGQPSTLARLQGWARHLAPLRHAGEVLGTLAPEWSARTGLSPQVSVYCGLHDSNAALLAARGRAELAGREATVLSTGTWFVAMRTPAADAVVDLSKLPEQRDCLVNVDVEGRPIPSARFMGGRELELLGGIGAADGEAELDAVPTVLSAGSMALPGWAPGVGPYPGAHGGWLAEPRDPAARGAATALYAALMTDAALELIGTRERLLVEGRFAQSTLFVRALAGLRPDLEVFTHEGHDGGVTYGALRLIDPALPPSGHLRRVTPLAADLEPYKARWRRAAESEEYTA